jgi:hypothetical protein
MKAPHIGIRGPFVSGSNLGHPRRKLLLTCCIMSFLTSHLFLSVYSSSKEVPTSQLQLSRFCIAAVLPQRTATSSVATEVFFFVSLARLSALGLARGTLFCPLFSVLLADFSPPAIWPCSLWTVPLSTPQAIIGSHSPLHGDRLRRLQCRNRPSVKKIWNHWGSHWRRNSNLTNLTISRRWDSRRGSGLLLERRPTQGPCGMAH